MLSFLCLESVGFCNGLATAHELDVLLHLLQCMELENVRTCVSSATCATVKISLLKGSFAGNTGPLL